MSYNFSIAKEKVTNNDMLRFACLFLNRRADGTVRAQSPLTLPSLLTTETDRLQQGHQRVRRQVRRKLQNLHQ
jgi:hypothetical protein